NSAFSRGVDEVDNAGWNGSRKTVESIEEQEEEALNRIVEDTQRKMINLSNRDGMTLNTSEYLARAQMYEEAIRTNDQNVSRGVGGAPRSPVRPVKRLLEDCGDRAVEWLTRPAPSHESLEEIRRWTTQMHDAVTKGIQVQHKTDLIVDIDEAIEVSGF
ncbi:hypothetical protein COOONC_24383, partial [Cooperia oncophora]